jgi:hypothetical protein
MSLIYQTQMRRPKGPPSTAHGLFNSLLTVRIVSRNDTGWTTEFDSRLARDLSLLQSVQTVSGAHPSSYPMGTGRVMRARCEAHHSPPSSVEVKNGGAIPPLPVSIHGMVLNQLSMRTTLPCLYRTPYDFNLQKQCTDPRNDYSCYTKCAILYLSLSARQTPLDCKDVSRLRSSRKHARFTNALIEDPTVWTITCYQRCLT